MKETVELASESEHLGHDHEADDLHGHNLDPKFFAHARMPQNLGQIPDANGRAVGIGTCGDQMEVTLSVVEGNIRQICHRPQGCVYTVACGSAMTRLAAGQSLDEALALTPEAVADELGGLPEDHHHCAALAVNTLGEAIDDYYQKIWGARPANAGHRTQRMPGKPEGV